jgi:hypothetical protein
MISALERRVHAAHRGDSDMVEMLVFFRSDRPCMSMYDVYYGVIADGKGWAKIPPT